MAFLIPDKIRVENGIEVKEKIIPWGATWPKTYGRKVKGSKFKADRLLSGGTGRVQGLSIHNTTDINEAPGTNDAEQYARATWPNANMRDVRVHYWVDETDAWQQLQENEVGAHAGDTGRKDGGNETTIAMEVIMKGDGGKDDQETERRAVKLAASILFRHGLAIDKLYTHNHWMGRPDKIVQGASKNCPLYLLPHWEEFKAAVEKELNRLNQLTAVPVPEADAKPVEYFAVQLGPYLTEERAKQTVALLAAMNILTWTFEDAGGTVVQVGAFQDFEEAADIVERLFKNGFRAAMLQVKVPKVSSPAPADVKKPKTYTVKKGDTLGEIAEMFGFTWADLQAENKLTHPNLIYPGQVLRIPTAIPETPKATYVVHTVVAGDTLERIAQKHGTTWQAIAELNGIKNPNLIYPGLALRIKVK